MGIVYIVYDHEHHGAYAAKTFQDEAFARNPATADRFTQEALAWVNLDVHQNVTQACFVQNIERKPFLFLEYVSGGNLSGWIGTPRLSEDLPQLLRFAIQFCDGMTHALSKGIEAHRDIKPQNCLITEDGTLKVTDFGLAKVFDDASVADLGGGETVAGEKRPGGLFGSRSGRRPGSEASAKLTPNVPGLSIGLSRTGTGAGTCTHMAPEQFDDAKHVDVRADIYSFGVLLFQMVTGRLPFVGRTWQDFERLHKTQPPPKLATRNPELETIVHTCLAKDPAHRFVNFGEVRERLAQIFLALTGEAAPQPAVGAGLDAAQWSNKGMSLADLGRHQDALACCDRALGINPRYAEAWSNKGVALGNMGRYHEAITCYDRAIQINPRDAVAWHNKGVVLGDLGRYQEASVCFDRAIEINPNLLEAWCNRGAALAKLGRHREAIACWDRVIEINPRYAEAWYSKGVALGDLGRYQEALACYDRAIEIDRQHAEAWSNKGVTLGNMGRYQEALACYDRAIEINRQHAEAWSNKGVKLGNMGRYQEAGVCFDHAIEINPHDQVASYNKGVALVKLGRYQEAIACFEETQRLGHPQAAQAIALCRQKLDT
jgi:tetratricopeptide (TPR) repeat protein